MSRGFWYLGCLTMPAVAVRVAGVAVGDVAFVLASVAAVLAATRFRPPQQRWGWTLAAVLAVIAALIAEPRMGQEDANLGVAARMVFLWVVWRFTATAVLGETKHVVTSLRLFILGCAASAVAGIAQSVFGTSVLGVSAYGLQSRATGLAEHVNDQGGQLAIAVAIGVTLWTSRIATGVFHLAMVATCALGLLASGSVTGMLALIAALVFIVTRLARRPGRVLAFGGLLGVAGYAAVKLQDNFTGVTPMERFATSTGGSGGVSTLDLRIRTLEFAWRRIQESPFRGAGLDTVSGGTYDGVTQTHNVFLLFWYQGGPVLLVALLLALGSALVLFAKQRAGLTLLAPALAAGFVAALVYAQTAPIMFQRYFWFPAVLLFAVQAIGERQTTPTQVATPAAPLTVHK